jgi:type I restriction enzyme M protein
MARHASKKPDSRSSSAATIGFEAQNGGQPSGARQTVRGSPQCERGGVHQFYTPSCVVRCLVEMLAPNTSPRGSAFLQSEASLQVVSTAKDKGRIYDLAYGSGGMFVQSEKFVESHGGKLGDISIYGQDKWARRQRPFGLAKRARRVRLRRQQPKQSNTTTRRLAVINLALRGIEADFGPEHADTFRRDLHPDLRADYVLANPPFSISDWGGENLRQHMRWKFGMLPMNNANYTRIQCFVYHRSPSDVAPFVLTIGSFSSNPSYEIRHAF